MLEQFRISRKTLIITTLIVLGLIAILIRLPFLDYQSGDYKDFLLPWYTHLSQYGFGAFHESFANYNFPYLYCIWILAALHLPALVSIKVVSFIFEAVLAVAVYLVVKHYRPKGWLPVFAGVLVLYLPTVFMNSSIWAQCDAIYVALVLFAFYAILKDRRVLMWLLWGVAFAFKLQSVVFLPILIYVWLTSKKSRLYDPFIALIPFVVSCLPALFAGQPLDSVLAVYASQASYYPYLSASAPSIYGLFYHGPEPFITLGRWLAAVAVGGLMVVAIFWAKRDKEQRYLLVLSALTVGLATFLLPQMHERYFYLTEIFSFVLACVSIRTIWIAVSVQFSSSIMYLVQFYTTDNLPFSLPVMAIVMGGAIAGLGYYFVRYFTTISLTDRFVDHK